MWVHSGLKGVKTLLERQKKQALMQEANSGKISYYVLPIHFLWHHCITDCVHSYIALIQHAISIYFQVCTQIGNIVLLLKVSLHMLLALSSHPLIEFYEDIKDRKSSLKPDLIKGTHRHTQTHTPDKMWCSEGTAAVASVQGSRQGLRMVFM